MTQYTPGPWVVAGYAGEHEEAGALIESAEGTRIATTIGNLGAWSTPDDWARYHANARVIALAPEMVELLRRVADHFGPGVTDSPLHVDTLALLSRVDGR